MKMYKITISKIEEKELSKREYNIIWIKKGTDEKEWGYIDVPNIEKVSTEIYSQKTDCDIDIKKVIDAFNQ